MCVNGKKRIIHKKEVYHLYKTASQWVETEASEIMLSLYISREKPFLPLIEQLLACHSVIQTAWSLSEPTAASVSIAKRMYKWITIKPNHEMLFFFLAFNSNTQAQMCYLDSVTKLHREKTWQTKGQGRADKRTCNFSEHFINLPLSPLCFDKMKQD